MVDAAGWDPGTHRPLVGGRYRLGPEVGRGGHSVVYAALDTRLSRRVAVKVLRAECAVPGPSRELFVEEQQALALMGHPGIVGVLDADLDPAAGPPWVVHTLVDGRTLRQVLDDEHEQGRVLDLTRVVAWAVEVLDALDHVHARGRVHGDVSPRNVMVTQDEDHVVLVDVGCGRLGERGVAPVTAAYAAPERVTGRSAGAPGDIYSLAAVLFTALTGRPPFEGEDAAAVAGHQVRSLPPSMASRRPDLPTALDRLVLAALAKDPADRPDAVAMRTALTAVAVVTSTDADVVSLTGAASAPLIAAGAAGHPRRVDEDTPPLVLAPPATRRVPVAAAEPVAVDAVVVGPVVVGAAPATGPAARGPAARGPAATGRGLPGGGAGVRRHGVVVLTLLALVTLGLAGHLAFATDGIARRPGAVPTVAASTVVRAAVPDVVVPAVLGVDRDIAVWRLEEAGLVVGATTEHDAAAAAGVVLAVEPGEGRFLVRGSRVALVLASGRTVVPEVVGGSLDAALAALGEAGLAVSWSRVQSTVAGVLRLTPAAGTTVAHGSTIEVVVGVRTPATPTRAAVPRSGVPADTASPGPGGASPSASPSTPSPTVTTPPPSPTPSPSAADG